MRNAGASVVDDWTPENCYPTLTAASAQSAAGDSILLFFEDHIVNARITLPAFIGNRDLTADAEGIRIICGAVTQFTIPATLPQCDVRGLRFVSAGFESDRALFYIPSGLVSGGDITFTACLFESLMANDLNQSGGSCLLVDDNTSDTELHLMSCQFLGNETQGRGGAIFIKNGWIVHIQDSQFVGNSSRGGMVTGDGRGGAIAVISTSSPSVVDCSRSLFSGNRAWGPGGALFLDDASLSLVETELSDSESAVEEMTDWCAGAGVFMRRTADAHTEPVFLTIENCLFERNIGHISTNPWAGDGGAILVKGIDDRYVDVQVSHSLFRENYNAQGGGLYIGRFATGSVDFCRFLDNTVYLQGGATFKGGAFPANLGETVVYTYCEFSGNRAGLQFDGSEALELGRGGAFSTRFHTRAEFHNCTFYNNSAHGPSHEGDAVLLVNEGSTYDSDLQRCDFINTVFYGTDGNSQQVVARDSSIGRLENCAYESGQFQTAGSTPLATVFLNSFPFVDALDLHPGLGSPLINAALDEGQAWDILGDQVPNGAGPDIGCYEAIYATAPVPDGRPKLKPLRAVPNPFNPRTVISYDLDQASHVSLTIHDLGGRRIVELQNGWREAGRHEVVWSGQDASGRDLPSSVFLVRIEAEGLAATHKLALIR